MSIASVSHPLGEQAVCPACEQPASNGTAVYEHPASLVRCSRCGLVYAYSTAQAADRAVAYPPDYYAHQPVRWTPGRGQMIRALALHRFYGYPLPKYLADRVPHSVTTAASLLLAPLKGYWRTIPRSISGGTLLDVGCGSGLYLARLRPLGWSVHGLEPDPEACIHAKDGLGLDVACGTFDNHPWPDGSFDVITLWHSLEHMAQPLHALQAAYTLLRPGGLLMIEVPNWGSLQRRIFGKHWFHLDLPRHLVHFSPRSLAQCLAMAGFTEVQVSAVPSTVGVTGSLSPRLPKSPKRSYPALSGTSEVWASRDPHWLHNRALKALVWPAEALLAPLGLAGCLAARARKR